MNPEERTRSCSCHRSVSPPLMARGSKQICIPMTRDLYDEIWHDTEPVRALLERPIAESPEVFPDGICAGYRLSGRLPESKKLPGIQFSHKQRHDWLVHSQYRSVKEKLLSSADERMQHPAGNPKPLRAYPNRIGFTHCCYYVAPDSSDCTALI